MDKIKVLQVNKLYAPHIGGVETVVRDIAEGLNDRVDMKVLVCQPRGKPVVDYVNGVEVTRAGSFGIHFSMPISFSFFSYLRKLSKDRDILHFHMPFPLGDAAYFLSGFNGKVVISWHSDIIRQKSLMKLYKPLMEKFLKRADCIITATEGHISGSKYLAPFRDKCVVIPFGIDINSYTENSHKSSGDTSPIVLPEHKKVKKVLFIGRLIYYKGVEVLLEAFSRVHGAHLYIVGDGPLRPKLENQAKQLHIDNAVTFLGTVDDWEIKEILHECDMFVLPSIASSEAFGLVQIEAMACSKPVINTSLPTGVPYVSIHGQTGLTVPPGNANTLGNAIQWLTDHDDERLQMGLQARERAVEHFSLQNMLNNIYNVYQSLV